MELAELNQATVLLIAKDGSELNLFHHALALFASNSYKLETIVIPDRETLPYDHFSPHPDIQSDRIKALIRSD